MSKLIETRAEFQQLAQERLEEAKALLDAGKWSGAYYLAGYAVELALKACIIKSLMARDAFPDKEFSKNCYTHAIEKLVALAKLDGARTTAMNADPILLSNWAQARDWSDEKRSTGPRRRRYIAPSPMLRTGCSHGSRRSGE